MIGQVCQASEVSLDKSSVSKVNKLIGFYWLESIENFSWIFTLKRCI
ncbi:MAG: hypothetical protein OFPII_15370 [Osedax symbiont Rs1]|nr:MAG: hypothetical protein OFPII_15370 [Osedax symbiont Rs1]